MTTKDRIIHDAINRLDGKKPFRDVLPDLSRQQKEYKLQCHLVEMHKIYFPHVIMIAYQARPSGETDEARKKDAYFKQQMGILAGVSDILLYWTYDYPNWIVQLGIRILKKLGFTFSLLHSGGIELKVDSGLSGGQNKWLSRFRFIGGKTGVAHSWEEYYHLLCSFGIRPKFQPQSFQEADMRSKSEKFQDAFDWQAP